VVKRAVNVHPTGAAQPGKVSVVSSYVHNKVGAEVLPEHIQVSRRSLSSKRDGTRTSRDETAFVSTIVIVCGARRFG
jgi:hypothetical protein